MKLMPRKKAPSVPTIQPLDEMLNNLKTPEPQAIPPQAVLGDPEPIVDEPPIHLTGLPPDDPYLPGFAMVDDPEDLPLPSAPAPAMDFSVGEAAPPQQSNPPTDSAVGARPIDVPTEDFAPPAPTRPGFQSGVRYESRIRVLEAYQYPGFLKDAPAWIDRNWTGYASDYDALRGIEPGPALRVPTRRGDEVALCRPGDYVVRQEVVLAHGIEPDVVTEVWPRESFEKNFIPEPPQNGVTSSQPPTPAREPVSLSA